MGARGGSVDLVREQDLSEDGPPLKVKAVFAVRVFFKDARPEDVGGHQVRRALESTEVEVQAAGDRSDQGCFAEAGRALKQDMPSSKEGV